jgi:hypothetical protein
MRLILLVLLQALASAAWSQELEEFDPNRGFEWTFDMPPRAQLPTVPDSGVITTWGTNPFYSWVLYCGNGDEPSRLHKEYQDRGLGAADFYLYHCAVFEQAERTYADASYGSTVPLLSQQVSLEAFALLNEELAALSLQLSWGASEGQRLVRASEIFQYRLVESHIDTRPLLTLRYTSAGPDTDLALALPFPEGYEAQTAELRRTTFTATVREDAETVRFIASGANVRVIDPEICMPAECFVPVANQEASITYEFLEFSPQYRELKNWAELEVQASVWSDGEWRSPVTEFSTLLFARCKATLIREMSENSLFAEIRTRLFALTLAVEGMTGRRIAEGPQFANNPDFGDGAEYHPGDVDDLESDPQTASLTALLDEVAQGRAVDAYLAANANMTGGLHEAIAGIDDYRGLTTCDGPDAEAALARITNQLVPVQRHLAEWEQRHFIAEAGAYRWQTRFERGMAWFDHTHSTAGAAIDPAIASAMLNAGVDAGFFLANRTLVEVVRSALNKRLGPENAGLILSPLAIYAAISETLRVGEALMDIETLFDLRAEMQEALSWMEMEAYFRIMVGRYEQAETDLILARDRLQDVRRRNCICWQPVE